MRKTLHINMLQTALHWENPKANRRLFTQLLEDGGGQADVVILPEMFTTGFSMRAEALAEPMDGASIHWMQEKAQQFNTALVGSLIIAEDGKYYNRLIWMTPDGILAQYDKKHLFNLAKEAEVYTAGKEKVIVEWRNWKFCPMICYDLRFPVWSRNVEDYDVLVYIANFPAMRSYAWRQLLKARAIENQCYVVAVNIVGKDGKGIAYEGDSCCIDPMGHLTQSLHDDEGILSATLQPEKLEHTRQKLPFLQDRDNFAWKLDQPQK